MVRSLYPYHQAARTRCSSIPLAAFLAKFFPDSWAIRVGRPTALARQVARSGDRPQRAMQTGHSASGDRSRRGTLDCHWIGRGEPALRSLCLSSEEKQITVVRPDAASIGAERSEEKNSFERGYFGWRRPATRQWLRGWSGEVVKDRGVGRGGPSSTKWLLCGIVRPGAECHERAEGRGATVRAAAGGSAGRWGVWPFTAKAGQAPSLRCGASPAFAGGLDASTLDTRDGLRYGRRRPPLRRRLAHRLALQRGLI
jgi:hypothetical protein